MAVPKPNVPVAIVGRMEGNPPKLAITLERPETSEVERVRATMGDPSLPGGKRNLLIQQYRVLEALAHKQEEEAELLAAFLERIALLQREYLLSRRESAWADVPLGTLASDLGCPLIALPKLLKDRGIAVGADVVRLDDLVGVGRFSRAGDQLGYVQPRVLVPTDAMRSRSVVDALLEVFADDRQFILDPVLVVPHPTDAEIGYVCEGNHRTAAAHLADAKVRIRLLKSKASIQFHLSGTQAARLAASSTYEAFVSACAEQAARGGYEAGSWDLYLATLSEAPDTSHAVRILTPQAPAAEGVEDDTSSDALRNAVMELFEGLPGRTLNAQEVEERLALMGVPKSSLPSLERMEFYLRHALRRVKEASPGRFTLDA